MKRTALIFAALAVSTAVSAQKSWDLKNFPEGSTPEEIGTRLVEHYLDTPHSHWGDINSKYKVTLITYPDVCAWLGSLWFAQTTGNDGLYDALVERFEPLFDEQKHLQPEMFPTAHNVVDFYVFGAVPLEIYKRVQEQKYFDLGMKYADGQWVMPPKPTEEQRGWQEKGYSWQTRLWVDDMLDKIQRPNGLFYHHTGTPYFWGRGDGWMAVGMAEMLRLMPKDSEYRPRIEQAYKLMMSTLLRYQDADGMWHQIIDNPDTWKETSSTAMFTYAFIVGVKNGWLDKKVYGEAARKGYLRLLSYLDENYDLRNVCEGTGAKNSMSWYQNRRRLTGDLHGQAALIWCCQALTGDVKPYKIDKSK